MAAIGARTAGYRALLRTPGVARLAASSLGATVAGMMAPLALLLFVGDVTGSFAAAGAVAGAAGLGNVALGPARGRLVDTRGASRAIVILALPGVASDVALIAVGRASAPLPVLLVLGFVAGAAVAPIGTVWRAVWSRQLRAPAAERAGLALMTVVQELSFIAGPLLTTAVVAAASSTVALAVAAGGGLAGALAFAADAAIRGMGPAAGPPGARPRLGTPAMRGVLAVAACFGLAFGALDVGLPALARHAGSPAAAGVLLAALAAGILVGGLASGLSTGQRSAVRRYPGLVLVAALGTAPLTIVPGLWLAVALAALAGLSVAPATACQLGVVGELAPEQRRAEAFAWLGTAYGTGSAAGAAAAGVLATATGVQGALGLGAVTMAVGAVVARVAITPRDGPAT